MNRKNISVLGGGSWGTVLAYLASLNGNHVNLWMRDNDLAEEINNTRINSRYLPNLDLGKNITATSQIEDIKESDLIKGGAGVRAQVCDKKGVLIDDFFIKNNKNIVNLPLFIPYIYTCLLYTSPSPRD